MVTTLKFINDCIMTEKERGKNFYLALAARVTEVSFLFVHFVHLVITQSYTLQDTERII